jgi:hypothetical protein
MFRIEQPLMAFFTSPRAAASTMSVAILSAAFLLLKNFPSARMPLATLKTHCFVGIGSRRLIDTVGAER